MYKLAVALPRKKKMGKEKAMTGSDGSAGGTPVRQEESGVLAFKKKRANVNTFWSIRFTQEKVGSVDQLFSLVEEVWIIAWRIQLERVGEDGVPHYQGVIHVEPRKRKEQLWNFFKEKVPELCFPKKDYCEKSKSSAADRYVMKTESRIAGPWEKGMPKDEIPYKIDIVLRPWQIEIDKIIQEEPDDRTIHWYWEPHGGSGKTTFQKWIFLKYKPRVGVFSGKATDMKNGVIKFLEKNGSVPEIVLLNFPKCTEINHISWTGVEELKDMFFYSGKYEGGMVCEKPPHLFGFANTFPPIEKMSIGRWIIHRIDWEGEETHLEPLWTSGIE